MQSTSPDAMLARVANAYHGVASLNASWADATTLRPEHLYGNWFEAFRFHMTLTDALPEAEREAWHRRLSEAYAAAGPELSIHGCVRKVVQ